MPPYTRFLISNDTVQLETSSTLVNIDDRLNEAENKLKSTFFIMTETTQKHFDDVLILNFQLYSNGSIPFIENRYSGLSPIKCYFDINVKYFWKNARSPPRFYLKVKVQDIVIYDIYKGVGDYATKMNKIDERILIDLEPNDIITVELSKDISNVNDDIEILKNSFLSFTQI